MSKYKSLQSQRWREIKEVALVFVLGTLILGGWFVLGIKLLSNPGQGLGGLDFYATADTLFLNFIPYSFYAVLVRWIDAAKQLCFIQLFIFSSEVDTFANQKHSNTVKYHKLLKKVQKKRNFLALTYLVFMLFTTLFFLGLACLSGFIWVVQSSARNQWNFLFIMPIFGFYCFKFGLLAKKLVTAIMKKM